MKKLLSILLVLILATSLFAFTSCADKETPDMSTEPSTSASAGTPSNEPPEEPSGEPADLPKAIFAEAGWDSIQFHNAVMMFIAENVYGMETEEISGDTLVTWAALTEGELNVYSEVWTDNIDPYGRGYRLRQRD